MMLKLPKLVNGKIVETYIDAKAITGFQPRELEINGKSVNGTKVYTTGGQNFKVPCSPLLLAHAKVHALTTGEVVALSAGKMEMQTVKLPGNVKVKALASGE